MAIKQENLDPKKNIEATKDIINREMPINFDGLLKLHREKNNPNLTEENFVKEILNAGKSHLGVNASFKSCVRAGVGILFDFDDTPPNEKVPDDAIKRTKEMVESITGIIFKGILDFYNKENEQPLNENQLATEIYREGTTASPRGSFEEIIEFGLQEVIPELFEENE